MSATTSTSYEETEKNYEGDLNIYLTRTKRVSIHLYGEGEEREIFRCNLTPLFTFMKQRLKNVDWEEISRTRDKKWGYKRLEAGELFEILSRSNLT